MYFGNKSITVHLLRGTLGLVAIYAATVFLSTKPWLSVVLFAVALFMLKGCPMCWTLGLFETIAMYIHKRHDNVDASVRAQGCSRATPISTDLTAGAVSADWDLNGARCGITARPIGRTQCPHC